MSEFSKLKRPQRGETEDDLVAQMKHFESTKASILPENILKFPKKTDGEKTSKFAAERQQQKKRQLDAEEASSNKSSINFILKSVVQEKEVDEFSRSESVSLNSGKPERSFPAILKCDYVSTQAKSSGKKMSLFAQQMSKQMPPGKFIFKTSNTM